MNPEEKVKSRLKDEMILAEVRPDNLNYVWYAFRKGFGSPFRKIRYVGFTGNRMFLTYDKLYLFPSGVMSIPYENIHEIKDADLSFISAITSLSLIFNALFALLMLGLTLAFNSIVSQTEGILQFTFSIPLIFCIICLVMFTYGTLNALIILLKASKLKCIELLVTYNYHPIMDNPIIKTIVGDYNKIKIAGNPNDVNNFVNRLKERIK